MLLIEALLCLLALATLLPVLVLFVQVLMALPAYRPRGTSAGRRPGVAILIPAHNEAKVISGTLQAIAPQLVAGDRLLVVADNCTDDTAKFAAAAGAEVVERFSHEHRGKGYALDFGVRHLEKIPPEVVLIVDADCEMVGGSIDRLARTCLETGRPVQALYLMRSSEAAGLKERIAELAWLVCRVRVWSARFSSSVFWESFSPDSICRIFSKAFVSIMKNRDTQTNDASARTPVSTPHQLNSSRTR